MHPLVSRCTCKTKSGHVECRVCLWFVWESELNELCVELTRSDCASSCLAKWIQKQKRADAASRIESTPWTRQPAAEEATAGWDVCPLPAREGVASYLVWKPNICIRRSATSPNNNTAAPLTSAWHCAKCSTLIYIKIFFRKCSLVR